MSSVKANERRKSNVEFDNNYFRVHDDAIRLIQNRFGASDKMNEIFHDYIDEMGLKIYAVIFDIGTHIRIANSIFPHYKSEYEERRLHQDKAIGLCFDLMTKYQLLMRTLRVKDDKYVEEIKRIVHEINCLKKWRTSDYNRFKDLG